MNEQKLECPYQRLDFTSFNLINHVAVDYKEAIGEDRYNEVVANMKYILKNVNKDLLIKNIQQKDDRMYSGHITVVLGLTMLDIEALESKKVSGIFSKIGKKFKLMKLNRKRAKLIKQIYKSQKIS